jgi:hypothetical protein
MFFLLNFENSGIGAISAIAIRCTLPILGLTGDPMKQPLLFVFALLFLASPSAAQDTTPSEPNTVWEAISVADTDNLNDFLWQSRPVVVFADSENDPRFEQQMALLEAQADALAERDIVVLTDTDASLKSPLRNTLRPRGFMIALIGKDGGVKLRKASPWDVRELTRVVDKMPMRQREVRDRREVDAAQE